MRLFLFVLIFADLIEPDGVDRLNRRLHCDLMSSIISFEGGKVLFVDDGHDSVKRHVSIQPDPAVGGRIELAVGSEKILIGKVGDLCRISS